MTRPKSGKGGYDFVLNDKKVDGYHEKLTLWSYEFKPNGHVDKVCHDDALLRREHDLFYVVPVSVLRNGKPKSEYRSILRSDLGKVRARGSVYTVWLKEDDYPKARVIMLSHLRKNFERQRDALDRTRYRINALLKEIDGENRKNIGNQERKSRKWTRTR